MILAIAVVIGLMTIDKPKIEQEIPKIKEKLSDIPLIKEKDKKTVAPSVKKQKQTKK